VRLMDIAVDSGRATTTDRIEQWGVYIMERHGIQFRDDHAGESRNQGIFV